MTSRLLSEYGINRPATIDVNLQAILFKERNQIGGVLLKHNCSLDARPTAQRHTPVHMRLN